MTKLRLVVPSWIVVGGLWLPVPLAAQAQSTSGRPASAKPAAKTAWTVPRTPWGDPDLQGNYTNVYENGTPFERPDQFAGRKLDEVKGEELATIKRATQEQTIKRFQTGFDAPDHWWQDALFLEKGSQAWFVVDPPDGKMGDARGHWEGDTLVVETTNFNVRSAYRNADADTLRLVERFTRVSADKVRWAVTVEDPMTWTRPWTFSLPLTMNDTEPIMTYECHEGNYGMRNILSAARAEEMAAADAQTGTTGK